jgi:hypothetical protein
MFADCLTNTPIIYINLDNTNNNVSIGNNSLESLRNNYNNCINIGTNVRCSGNSQINLGTTNDYAYTSGATHTISDERDKTDIKDTELGLDFINKLRPVDFRWNYRDDYEIFENEYENINNVLVKKITQLPNNESKKRNRYHHGFIAQDIENIINTENIDFGGFQNHSIKGGKDKMTLGYQEFIAPLVKAIQELSHKNSNLENKIIELENKINLLNNKQ